MSPPSRYYNLLKAKKKKNAKGEDRGQSREERAVLKMQMPTHYDNQYMNRNN